MDNQIVTLSDISVGGKGSYGIAASAVPFSDNLFTYLRITDINDDGTLNLQDLKSVDDDRAKDYLLAPNDIVFARTGASTGRNYFYDGTDGEFVYAGFLIKFSIDSIKVNPKYIKYYCQSKQYKDWINSFNTGSTRGNINAQTLGKMPIPFINRNQQDALVSILSSIDEKIRSNTEINCNLEQQAQALFKSWFSDISYFAPLSDVTINITDGVHNTVTDTPNGEYLLLSCKNIKGGKLSISKDERRIDKATFDKLRKRTKLDKGDILLSSVGTIGEILFLNSNPTNIEFQRSVAIIKADNNKISPEY